MNNLEEGDYCCFTTMPERADTILKLRALGITIGPHTWMLYDDLQDFVVFPILKYTEECSFIVSTPSGSRELLNEYSVEEFLDKASSPKKPKDRYKGHSIKHYFI